MASTQALDRFRPGRRSLAASETMSGGRPHVRSDRDQAGAPHAWFSLLELVDSSALERLIYCTVVKRAVDLVAALVALVVLGPLFLVIALAIRMDSPGPALFRQVRIGRGGQPFVIYKFRTMVADPAREFVLQVDADGTLRHKVRADPRVTRFGRLLRRSSLDELPQLLNVVQGDMSLIGPRPELPRIVQDYADWQHRRHLVRPGLTGWWQVSGRSDQPMHEHTELDLHYIEHLSLWLDVRILLRTVRVVLRGLGAF